MKGLTLQTIGFLIIAIIGILLLMMFVQTPLKRMATKTFCFFYRIISTEDSGICKSETNIRPPISLCADSREELARYIGAYTIKCWQEIIKPFSKRDIVCYQLLLECHPGNVSEVYMTEILEREGGCKVIQNSMVTDENGVLLVYSGDCGEDDQIKWDVSGNVIYEQGLVLIKYDVNSKKIIIKS